MIVAAGWMKLTVKESNSKVCAVDDMDKDARSLRVTYNELELELRLRSRGGDRGHC